MSDDRNEEEEDPLRELLKEVLNSNIANKKQYETQTELMGSVRAVVSEFLDSFIIVGYDFEGNPVATEGSSNTQQRDALETLFLRYFCHRTGYKIPGVSDEGFEF